MQARVLPQVAQHHSRYSTELRNHHLPQPPHHPNYQPTPTAKMPITLTLPTTYGYTAILALGAIPLLSFFQGMTVSSLRKAARVPYPNAYASAEQSKSSPEAYKFNCAQRAHGNLLENMPQTIAMLLFAGLFYPTATPVLGATWVVGRVLYAYGYITSKENGKGRSLGAVFWLGQLGLMGLCVSAGLKMI
ncbi:hypothetical protein DOTSEDRAFT_92243 [Dothistroma septosporum NZE10]|uniref:Glutathione S-transferase n=1 Tax=Dothistroma septosporum (strain NZE10 / CBS 128990) TaxID=675120 RepID=M2YJ86_DOTSN|nr:hypothetical protein DOTSEDRAFT_92243 [Dothistroma septosporum NZE10]